MYIYPLYQRRTSFDNVYSDDETSDEFQEIVHLLKYIFART